MANPSSKFPNLNLAEGFNALKVKNISQAVVEAEQEILARSSGTQFALKSRLPKLDGALGGGHQMGNIYLYAGGSGSGKSYFSNQLESDFCNPELNKDYPHAFVVVNFNFEMAASDEVIRSFSNATGISYGEIMSSVTPFADFGKYRSILLEVANRPVFFVETSGNRKQILATLHAIHLRFPNHQMVIKIDHSLLVDFLDEKDEIELLAKLAKVCIQARKNYDCLIILLGQMNDKIENPFRIQNAALHYPSKTDIHGSKQLYWACDYVTCLHRPHELGIEQYGKHGYPTKDLIAAHLIKARKGVPGLLRLKSDLHKGQINQWV